LVDQVGQFVADLGGTAAPSDSLYVIGSAAGNDARDAFEVAAGGGDPTAIIDAVAANTASAISTLATNGARHFVVWNVPDIGLAPLVQLLASVNPDAPELATGVAEMINTLLDSTLADLVASLSIDIIKFDAFDLTQAIVSSPAAFGLTDATSACVIAPDCLADPTGYFFWDGIHPTTEGHRVIARAALKARETPLAPLRGHPRVAHLGGRVDHGKRKEATGRTKRARSLL
jgi:outer membrane lipase/esterase